MMNLSPPSSRFSLLSLLLLITAIAAGAGWIGALRQARAARREALGLRRELEHQRAGAGALDVADLARVHAVGLPSPSAKDGQWRWRVFVPSDRPVELVLETVERQSIALPSGEQLVSAYFRESDGQVWLQLMIGGLPAAAAPLSWLEVSGDRVDEVDVVQLVEPGGRAVWERDERAVLVRARSAHIDRGEFAISIDVVGS